MPTSRRRPRPAPGGTAFPAALLAALLIPALPPSARAAVADDPEGPVRKRTVEAHIHEPLTLEPTPERRAALKAPPGFAVEVFAEGLGKPRIVEVAPNGDVYVTRREPGDLLRLRDADGDGRADGPPATVFARPQLHGLAIDGDEIFLTTVADVFRARLGRDGGLEGVERVVSDLPVAGQHPNRVVRKGPDGALYVSVGSTCNACDETDPELATILRLSPDGKDRAIFASGLRNTIGYAWHPTTGELWGLDMGIDWLGDDDQPEELNLIAAGARYGWPYVYADGRENPQDEPPGGIPVDTWRKMSREPELLYTAHASPLQALFYTGEQFPAEYQHDLLVTFRGSWGRAEPSGYEVVRVRFEDGRPVRAEPFLTGFLQRSPEGEAGAIGRPVGLAQLPDGSLLVGDDTGGIIYRVRWAGEPSAATSGPVAARIPTDGDAADGASRDSGGGKGAPAASATSLDAPPPGHGRAELALAIPDLRAPAPLQVSSAAFADGGAIPEPHTAYGEKFSPALAWAGAPAGTRSFAVLVEDPDAGGQPNPFLHWLAYDIPAAATGLPEAIPTTPRTEAPLTLLQGANSRGSTGWTGPKPPAGDPPHRYRFQVFALDRETLGLLPGASREDALNAMAGRVLAAGEVAGTYGRPAAATAAAEPAAPGAATR